MKRVGVIGHPLGHSLSPTIFQVAFEAAGVEAAYEAWDTAPKDLESRIAELRTDDVLGANVTVPHKEAVLSLLDRLDERAERIGAVNVIATEAGKLVGYNTDVSGFARALKDDASFEVNGKHAALFGAGGAARAVALALIEAGASTIVIVGRTPSRAGEVCADLRPLARAGTLITWTYWGDGAFLRVLPEADLIVNCTPIGTQATDSEGESPLAADLIADGAVVFDLVYNPAETLLLKLAKERGAKPVSGLGMLVYQAADAFRLWTGKDAPVERMLEAGRGALAESDA